MIFDTQVGGIPCKCEVNHYSPHKLMRSYGTDPMNCDPPEPVKFEFSLLDSKGYAAKWLEKKLTDQDEERLLEEFQITRLGERYGYL